MTVHEAQAPPGTNKSDQGAGEVQAGIVFQAILSEMINGPQDNGVYLLFAIYTSTINNYVMLAK